MIGQARPIQPHPAALRLNHGSKHPRCARTLEVACAYKRASGGTMEGYYHVMSLVVPPHGITWVVPCGITRRMEIAQWHYYCK